jgi:undecaprenyl-diphosphatase
VEVVLVRPVVEQELRSARAVWRKAFGRIRGYRDLRLLVAPLIAVLGVWGFLKLAGEVAEGETQRFDQWVLQQTRAPGDPHNPIGPPWLKETGRDLTALGGTPVLLLVTLAVAGFLGMRRQYRALTLLLAAAFGGMLLTNLLKDYYGRPRPPFMSPLMYVAGSSFPSGHSMMSAVVYLTLGAVLSRMVRGTRLRLYILTVALLMTLLVGISRVYMGVHYPTDVLAGWTAGLIWAVLCWLVAYHLQRRGSVEQPAGAAPGRDNGATDDRA